MAPLRGKRRFTVKKFRRSSVRGAGSSTGKRKYRGRATLNAMTQLTKRVNSLTRTIGTTPTVQNR